MQGEDESLAERFMKEREKRCPESERVALGASSVY